MVRRILGAGALVASLLTVATPPASAWTRSPWRIAGSDRYQTSVDLSHAAYPNGAPTAVLVSGTAFPDGLAAGPLAALDKGPVLLTQPDALPMNVAVELQRLRVTSVTVVGGTAAVQDHVLDQITQVTGATTTRLAGIDRYDTAAKVADQFPAAAAAAYVADGITFPDALTAGAAAATAGVPLVLVAPDAVPTAATDALRRLQPGELRVIGGPSAVSDADIAQLQAVVPSTRRIAGNDRYGTAAAVATDGGGRPAEALVATGDDFPDALAAAPLAALRGAPVFLTAVGCAPDAMIGGLRTTGWPDVTIIGGPTVVTNAAGAAVPCSPVPDGQLAPGVGENTQVLPGPVVVHVLTIDRTFGYDVRTVSATGRLQGLLPVTGIARRTGAIAAVNGDFFLGDGEPDHGFAVDGRLLKFPGDVNTLVGFDPAKPRYGFFGVPQPTVAVDLADGSSLPLARVNNGEPSGNELALFTPENLVPVSGASWCRAVLQDAGAPTVNADAQTIEPHTVVSTDCSSDPVPRSTDVLVAPAGSDVGASIAALTPGSAVNVRWRLHTTDQGVTDAIGANITLVFGSQVASDVTANNGSFFRTRAARTAVAQRPDGTILLVTVDRAPFWSIGMTPRELADYLVGLGVIDAANLDGGGSTAMAANGLLVNHPEDGDERAVATALVIVPHGTDPTVAPLGG